MKYIIYARKSSEDKNKQIQSVDSQIEVLKDYAKRNNLEVVSTLFEEKSGKKPGIRPVFAKMINQFENGGANGILVWKLDRIARNLLEGGLVIDMLQNGVIQEIRTPEEKHLPTDNVYSIAIQLCGANQYSRDLSTNVKRGLKDKLKKGKMPCLAPIGYLNTKIEARGENYIVIDPERFNIVRKMWNLMLTGNYSVPQVRDVATNEWNLLTPKKKRSGGVRIGYTSAYNIFSNLFYTGQFRYRGITYPGDHKAMITLAEFDLVQTRLKEKGNPRPKSHEFAYGCGTLRCGECDYSIVGIEKIKFIKSEKTTRTYTLYLCGNKGKVISCSQKDNVNENMLEAQMKAEIAKYSIDQEFLGWALEVMRDNDFIEVMTDKDIKENIAKTLEDKQEELRKLIKMATRGFISDEEFKESRAEMDKTINNLKSQLNEVESDKNEQLMELTEKAFVFSTYALIALQNGDKQRKKEVIKSFGLNRTIKDKKLSLVANEWYSEIRKGYFSIKEVLAEYEPEPGLKTKTIYDFPVLRSAMRGRPDLNRRSPS